MKSWFTHFLARIRLLADHPKGRILLAVVFLASISQLFVLILFTNFLWPKTISYNFSASQTCYQNPLLLPSLIKPTSQKFETRFVPSIKLAGKTIYSNRTCVRLSSASSENISEQLQLKSLGSSFLAQTVKISAPLPRLTSEINVGELTSTKETFTLQLSQSDKTFAYRITGNQLASPCESKNDQVVCSLTNLKLEQSKTYTIAIERTFNNQQVSTLFQTSIKTIEPIIVTSSSINQSELVYSSPKEIVLTLNKPASSHELTLKTSDGTDLKTEVTAQDNTLHIIPAEPLPREKSMKLSLTSASSSDGAYLDTPYELSFATSGGPRVTGINLGTYGIDPATSARVSFDYDINQSQDFGSLVQLSSSGGAIPVTFKASARTLTITPRSSLPRCSDITIQVQTGFQNTFGIPSSKPWKYTFRTICQEVFSIGTSVQGRSITAYKFGSGPTKIIFVGATHGDEVGSKYLLDSWINELEANYPKIPSTKTIIVIPAINPDGVVANTRTNANNVDLNRNFATNDWKKDVIMPGGNLLVNGGGQSALSEPESKAIASYLISQNPRLVLTYHSKASMVVSNESGDATAIAELYGRQSSYFATADSKLGSTFSYDTTGAMENWLHEKYDLPALLIELKTHTTNEFSHNKSALWSMVNL